MNVPNAITVARILLVPVFVVLSYSENRDAALAAFLVFLIASLSDFVDGYIARRLGIESKLGEFLDPLADKLLVGASLVVLVATRDFPLWAALAIAFREAAVQLLRIRIVSTGGRLPASPVAKLKTVVQIWMVGWWLLPWTDINVGHWMWLGATLLTTAWSGAQYFARAQKTSISKPGRDAGGGLGEPVRRPRAPGFPQVRRAGRPSRSARSEKEEE